MSCVLMARWTEDLTLDFDPGEMLLVAGLAAVCVGGRWGTNVSLFLEHLCC